MITYESSDTRTVFLASAGLLRFSGILSCRTTMPVIGYNGILTYYTLDRIRPMNAGHRALQATGNMTVRAESDRN